MSKNTPVETLEPILVENPQRYVLFPIQHKDLYDFYKKAQSGLWVAEEVDLKQDIEDYHEKLNDNERYFINNILAFFAASDGIVNENLALNFQREVQYPEAKAYYTAQSYVETVHSEMYSLFIDTYIKDPKEQHKYFHALTDVPCVKKKGEWAIKYIDSPSFQERLVAFAVVEAIFFSGSFCAIFWLKKRNLMPGLSFANEQISTEEHQHAEFASHIYRNHIVNKLPESKVRAIVDEALQIEKEFITESLPVSLIGMNADMMKQYLEYVSDNLLTMLGLEKVYKSKNPFPFMEQIALKNKTNFFEKRVAEYNKAKSGESAENNELAFDDSLLD